MTSARRTRFFFFLNPYADMAFTRCPKCETNTKQRKLPLVIHIESHTICVLNKTCRFCPACELVIAKRAEIEPLLLAMIGDSRRAIEKGDYLVVGTLDRADWRAGRTERRSPAQTLDCAWVFRDHWDFKVTGGWQLPDRRLPE
jgi:MinD superfamily P-loop ATPase